MIVRQCRSQRHTGQHGTDMTAHHVDPCDMAFSDSSRAATRNCILEGLQYVQYARRLLKAFGNGVVQYRSNIITISCIVSETLILV